MVSFQFLAISLNTKTTLKWKISIKKLKEKTIFIEQKSLKVYNCKSDIDRHLKLRQQSKMNLLKSSCYSIILVYNPLKLIKS